MELHQLRYFIAVADLGNFTKASLQSHVSQPSLSQQIMKLEGELGQRLFDRLGHRAALTAAGAALYDRARRILIEVDEAARAVREEDGTGRLRLGVLPSIAPYLLPELLSAVRAGIPNIEIEIDEDFRAPLVEAILRGKLDAVIGTPPEAHKDLEIETLFSEALLVALAENDPLASRKSIAPPDLVGKKLILLGEASSLGVQARKFFGENQIPIEIACRCAQVKTMKALVAAGLGIAIMPQMAVSSGHPGVVFRAVSGVRPRRQIVLIRHTHRYHSKSESRFVDLLRGFCVGRSEPEGD